MSSALQSLIARGLAASRPAAGTAGALYFATDTGILSRDNGATWDDISFDAAGLTGLATVATSGDYGDLANIPSEFTPSDHAITHAIGGGDELSPADIGAATSGHDHDADYDAIGAASTAETNAKDYADLTFVPLSEKGAADGVATLVDGKVPNAQLPALAITDTFVVSSQSAMLALTAAETGDVAVRSDQSKSYILAGDDPTTLGDWQELLSPPNAVSSVDGATGAVSLSGSYAPLSHTSATTSVHGITNTADLVATTDKRLTAGGQFIFGWRNDGGLTAPDTADVVAPYAATITGWTIVEDTATSSSATFDLWKGTPASQPTVSNSIVGAAYPTLTTATSATGGTTGWSGTSVAAGDLLRTKLTSVTSAKRLTLVISYTRA